MVIVSKINDCVERELFNHTSTFFFLLNFAGELVNKAISVKVCSCNRTHNSIIDVTNNNFLSMC